jgi:outer membrane lipoprotein LolB
VKRALGTIGLATLLTACAVTPPRGTPGAAEQAWRSRQAVLATLTDWSFTGRIGITLGDQGWHASLDWRQQAEGYDIQISGPLGQGVGMLHGGPDGVLLRTSDHKERRATDAESLLQTQFGWWVPVSGLRYWLRGLPDPQQSAQTSLDEYGRLALLKQAGWEIRFARYAQVADLALPDRLTLSNDKMKVKLIVDAWRNK